MSTAQLDGFDLACLKFERAGPSWAQNSNLFNGLGRAGLKAGTGRAEKSKPVHSSTDCALS